MGMATPTACAARTRTASRARREIHVRQPWMRWPTRSTVKGIAAAVPVEVNASHVRRARRSPKESITLHDEIGKLMSQHPRELNGKNDPNAPHLQGCHRHPCILATGSGSRRPFAVMFFPTSGARCHRGQQSAVRYTGTQARDHLQLHESIHDLPERHDSDRDLHQCHTAHHILAPSDPPSSVNAELTCPNTAASASRHRGQFENKQSIQKISGLQQAASSLQ